MLYITDETTNEILEDISFEVENVTEITSYIATSMNEQVVAIDDLKDEIQILNGNLSTGIYFLFVLVMFEILRLVKGTFRRVKK